MAGPERILEVTLKRNSRGQLLCTARVVRFSMRLASGMRPCNRKAAALFTYGAEHLEHQVARCAEHAPAVRSQFALFQTWHVETPAS